MISVPDTPLFSIGYGDRPWEEFLSRLRDGGIRFVIDVRSHPNSRQPEFNRASLEVLLRCAEIQYIYMGDLLGGQPEDPACYVNGRVDYESCERTEAFQAGLNRLVAAHQGGHRVAVMCSELDPERCHRSKLIGEALRRRNVPMAHIDRGGTLASQADVIARLTGGQTPLFEEGFTSRGRYQTRDAS